MATEQDIRPAVDRGEGIAAMQPMKIGEGGSRFRDAVDLALELTAKSAAFRSSLPPAMRTGLADLVRAMNCYYSNLIEGHDTHPVDIERALKNDFSADPAKRDLQLEATAHIAVQGWIDGGGLSGRATSVDGLREVHRRGGSRNLNSGDKWIAGLTAAMLAASRRQDEQATPPEPQPGVQGQGGIGCRERREDAG